MWSNTNDKKSRGRLNLSQSLLLWKCPELVILCTLLDRLASCTYFVSPSSLFLQLDLFPIAESLLVFVFHTLSIKTHFLTLRVYLWRASKLLLLLKCLLDHTGSIGQAFFPSLLFREIGAGDKANSLPRIPLYTWKYNCRHFWLFSKFHPRRQC